MRNMMENLKKVLNVAVLFTLGLLLSNCSSKTATGELVGTSGRSRILQPVPFGMTYIEGGSFMRGVGDQDPAYQSFNPKQISISAFYMDETEITNDEYRQFVNYVADSITRRLLGEAFPDEYLIESPDDDNTPPAINWKTKIKWTDPAVSEALEPLYMPLEERYYHRKEIDVRKLNYEYYTFDHDLAAQKSFIVPEDPKDDGVYYASFVNRPQSLTTRKNSIQKHVVNVYPDTLCWIFDWVYSYNEPMTRSYFNNGMYDYYPVVGINWVQANAFCVWRTNANSSYMESKGYPTPEVFRLPTEAEWEYAARGGLDLNPYPWGGPYARNQNGCVIGNFKPQRGNYTLDGSLYPCIVGHYAPNDFGLYDMMGNVAEWCIDAYEETYLGLHDFNPVFKYDAKPDDPIGLKRKVIKGGSFKDFAELTKTYARLYEYQDTCKSYIGFRCVQSFLGRGMDDNLKTASNVY